MEFKFVRSGITVKGATFPIVVMEWIEGDPLGVWLDKNHANPNALQSARQQFQEIASYLEKNGLAHGDIQNGNIIMSNRGIKLIDYDGMYVPGLPLGGGTEIGHKHFQHPQRTTKDYGPTMDRFSFIVLDLSLQALTEDSTLHRRFREGGEAIIFKANDFADPHNSEVFRLLASSSTLAKSTVDLIGICNSNINNVPRLEEFLKGVHIPCVGLNGLRYGNPAENNERRRYISAFPVVDAKQYEVALKHVGDRVELVGRISEVKTGVGRQKKVDDMSLLTLAIGVAI